MQQNAAYDLETFAPREPRERLHVAARTKKRRRLSFITLRNVKIAAVAVIVLSLVCSVLYSQTKATEMSGQIAMQQQELLDLQSEYTYLSNEVEMKTNLTSVEEYARTKLGLVKIDKSQITYVERKNDEVIVRPKNELQKIFGSVSTQAMSFMEYLTP
ncbi:MAG: hypothetical protein RR415_06915 [Ruthenibacterium sp.]